MSSFQASSTLYSPEYYKSGHSVDQNMYIVNTSTGHTGHTLKSVHAIPYAQTRKQMHKQEQEDDRRHKEQVQKRHKAMMDRRHGHGDD
jgi:hypothetical protein